MNQRVMSGTFSLSHPCQDLKLKNSLMIGQMDVPLEDKLVTVVYGTDMVNLNMVHFACSQKETAQVGVPHSLTYSLIP